MGGGDRCGDAEGGDFERWAGEVWQDCQREGPAFEKGDDGIHQAGRGVYRCAADKTMPKRKKKVEKPEPEVPAEFAAALKKNKAAAKDVCRVQP